MDGRPSLSPMGNGLALPLTYGLMTNVWTLSTLSEIGPLGAGFAKTGSYASSMGPLGVARAHP